jgi:thiol-disulfide isomerase/thioredoxin
VLSTRPRPLRIAAALLAVVAATTARAPAASPPDATAILEAADESLGNGDFKEAIRRYKEADKVSGGSCVECQLGLAKAFNGVRAHKEVLKAVEAVLRLTTDKPALALAYNEQGLALLASADGDQGRLKQAEAAFRNVISHANPPRAHFNLGVALLRQGRDEEGVAALRHYLTLEPDSPSAESAKELIDNPLRARKRLIPDLELVTLGGEYLTTDDLRGRVVLIDVWGTWCAPCRAAVPELKRLAARLKKAPFLMVSISNDADGPVLKKFIAEHAMDWPQVWDEDHTILRRLGINRFPTYLLIDHEGEIVFSASGWGPAIDREIEHRVARAVQDARKAAPREAVDP